MFDFNLLEDIARSKTQLGEYREALMIYLYMADGDPSLDGGYLAEQIAKCYEALMDLHSAKYWYGKAVEENPEVRSYSMSSLDRLKSIGIDDLVSQYLDRKRS